MKLESQVTEQSAESTIHCIVIFADIQTKIKESILECLVFDLFEQDWASGLMGSISVGPDPDMYMRNHNETNPQKIIESIRQFFAERNNWEEMKKTWVFAMLFEKLSVKATVTYTLPDNIKQSLTLDSTKPFRQGTALFRPRIGATKKFYTTQNELQEAIFAEIKKHLDPDMYAKIIENKGMITVL